MKFLDLGFDSEHLKPDESIVWIADTDSLGNLTADSLLTPGERLRAGEIRNAVATAEFRLGRWIVRSIMHHLKPEFTFHELDFLPGGRPEFPAPLNTWRFSIAHSHGRVAVGLTRGRSIGVDIEWAGRTQAVSAVLEILTERERREVSGTGQLFEYWTLKESLIKARGLSLSALDQLEFSLPPRHPAIQLERAPGGAQGPWSFHTWRLPGGFVLAAAAEARGQRFLMKPLTAPAHL